MEKMIVTEYSKPIMLNKVKEFVQRTMYLAENKVIPYAVFALLDSGEMVNIGNFNDADTAEIIRIILKLSITLDTLTARILKLSSDSQSRIEPTPFYSWWEPTDCRADSAVTPVAHKISPDHRF